MHFVYSAHETREEAEQALIDYFGNGEISEAERPYIVKARPPYKFASDEQRPYHIMFPG